MSFAGLHSNGRFTAPPFLQDLVARLEPPTLISACLWPEEALGPGWGCSRLHGDPLEFYSALALASSLSGGRELRGRGEVLFVTRGA